MTNRTLRFYGQGYSSSPVSIVATFDGNTVYSGTVPTIDQAEYNWLPDQQQILFTCECDTKFSGVKPVTITVSGGTLVVAQTLGNYYKWMPNPVYTPEQYSVVSVGTPPNSSDREAQVAIWTEVANPPLSAEDISMLTTEWLQDLTVIMDTHNINSDVLDPTGADIWTSTFNTASHTDVMIAGVPQPALPGVESDVSYVVPNGEIIGFNQNILPS